MQFKSTSNVLPMTTPPHWSPCLINHFTSGIFSFPYTRLRFLEVRFDSLQSCHPRGLYKTFFRHRRCVFLSKLLLNLRSKSEPFIACHFVRFDDASLLPSSFVSKLLRFFTRDDGGLNTMYSSFLLAPTSKNPSTPPISTGTRNGLIPCKPLWDKSVGGMYC